MRLLRILGAATALVACHSPPGELSIADVMVMNCGDILDVAEGPECELDREGRSHIRVWMPKELLVARIDGEPQTPISQAAADDGWRVTLAVPKGAGALTLSRVGATGPLWRLPFTWTDATHRSPAIQARDAMGQAYVESRMTDCRREARRASALADAERRGNTAMLAALTGARCSGAEPWHEWIAMAARIPAGPDERELDRAALEAQYFQREGALSQALATAERALKTTLRTGSATQQVEFLLMQASVLTEMGDFSAAISAIRTALERDSTARAVPCTRASLYFDLAWVLLQQSERVPATDRESLYDALYRGMELAKAPDNRCRLEDLAAFRLNWVRVLQLERNWSEAGRELEILGHQLKAGGDGAVQAEFQLLRARQALATGRAAAARSTLEATNSYRDLPDDLRLELTLARGEVEEALGSWRAAFDLYQRSRRMTHDRLPRLPSDGSMQRFLVDRLRGVQRLVELSHSRFADHAAAFRLAREAAGTEVRWLLQRDADASDRRDYLTRRDEHERRLVETWDLSPATRQRLRDSAQRAMTLGQEALLSRPRRYEPTSFELRAAAPGELLLLYFPLDARRFMAFAATATGIETAIIDLEQSALPGEGEVLSDEVLEVWSERLLAPLAPAIDRARSIRVLPSFGVQALPFHALPWHGEPLLAHAPVAYGLDLPVRDRGRVKAAQDSILIVGDPLGDLGGARRETEELQASIRAPGAEIRSLVGRRATGSAVRAYLPRAAHFHYAGHSASAGAFGWGSTLRLAQDTSLTVTDIIALDQVPSTVVLLSCDAGHVSRDSRAQGISLAAAFAFAGSEAVIAMSTPVDATEAPRLAAALHDPFANASELAVTYRTELLRLRQKSLSDTPWQGLRLWVP
ncbi:CHAT domain-containing protein [Nannocystis pusilla]|uniref:CHAT domain-containing protein n=1 Tax=Nannocystis pusilla TaxID=889268 RepID=UPI003BF364FE